MRNRGLIRAGLAVLTVAAAGPGGWALFAPESFYLDFPTKGRAWVASLGAYDEHLIRDVGALFLALAIVCAAATVIMEVRLVRTAALAYLVFGVPHLIFHATHRGTLESTDNAINLALLGGGVAVAALVLLLSAGGSRGEESADLSR